MQTITSSAELKEAIHILEAEQSVKGQALKEQFRLTYDSLKPANLFLSAMNDIAQSPKVLDNLLGTSAGLLGGFLTRKIIVGSSGSIFRKLVGSLLQFGVSNLVSNNSGVFRSFGQIISQLIGQKRKSKAEDEAEDEEIFESSSKAYVPEN